MTEATQPVSREIFRKRIGFMVVRMVTRGTVCRILHRLYSDQLLLYTP